MLNQDSLKILPVHTLKLFCKNVGIKNYSKLNKNKLFEEYSQYLACKIIQRAYRQYFYRDSECSITLEKVEYPCFVYRTKFGKHFFYSYDAIIKYIMKTGDTRDPMTRNQYTDDELTRLDTSVKQHYPEIRYSSTLKIKKNINYAKRIRNRENEALSYQTHLEELKVKILIIIESNVWNIQNICIDSVEYSSINDYLSVILSTIGTVYRLLKNYDSFAAGLFKEETIHSIEVFNSIPEVSRVLNYFNQLN